LDEVQLCLFSATRARTPRTGGSAILLLSFCSTRGLCDTGRCADVQQAMIVQWLGPEVKGTGQSVHEMTPAIEAGLTTRRLSVQSCPNLSLSDRALGHTDA